MQKLCKDCKWMVRKGWWKFKTEYCGHPELVDKVTGESSVPCYIYRVHTCGESGKYWEKK